MTRTRTKSHVIPLTTLTSNLVLVMKHARPLLLGDKGGAVWSAAPKAPLATRIHNHEELNA
jgi:hypothetical protein